MDDFFVLLLKNLSNYVIIRPKKQKLSQDSF